jgi:hypothetical protein
MFAVFIFDCIVRIEYFFIFMVWYLELHKYFKFCILSSFMFLGFAYLVFIFLDVLVFVSCVCILFMSVLHFWSVVF